jgi:hypothetical protein
MRFPYLKYLTGFLICICLLSYGCGKVVQQTSSETEKTPRFSLTFTLSNIILKEEIQPTQNESNKLIQKPDISKHSFSNKAPIYILLKSYKENKAYDLAWAKSSVTATLKSSSKNSPKSLQNKQNNYTYSGSVHDSKKIKVISAKESQFEGNFNATKKEWNFKTNHVKKKYDYYLTIAYETPSIYQMKTINDSIVSKNKTVTLELTPLSTFHSLIFMNSFRSTDFSKTHYELIDTIFNNTFFKALNYVLPSLDVKNLEKKSPIFKIKDPIIEECSTIIELILADKKEAEEYIKNLEKSFFTSNQKQILLKNIRSETLSKTL